MPLLVGKLLVTCPRSGEEVKVKKKCVACQDYKHTSFRGEIGS
jgi:hypothetical protein